MRIKFKHSKSWKRINYLLKKFRRGEHNCEWLGNFYSERRSGRSASRKLKARLIAKCKEKKKEKMSRCFVRQEEQTVKSCLKMKKSELIGGGPRRGWGQSIEIASGLRLLKNLEELLGTMMREAVSRKW